MIWFSAYSAKMNCDYFFGFFIVIVLWLFFVFVIFCGMFCVSHAFSFCLAHNFDYYHS